MNLTDFINGISSGAFDDKFRLLYGSSAKNLMRQKTRYISAAENFSKLYPECSEIRIFSAPGRTEIGGNHTDHQHGCVLAAAVDLDAVAFVSLNSENTVRISSEGYSDTLINLSDIEAHGDEKGTTTALVRGILRKFREHGTDIKGFNAYITSDVLSGSGLSSSAAFEVLIGNIIDRCFNETSVGAEKIAKIGQFAENEYFGKSSGLMDQMVASVGGFVFIDFHDIDSPAIDTVDFDFQNSGYSLCIVDTKGSHGDLTDDYSAIPEEMCHVAQKLGAEYLREITEDDFYSSLPDLRKDCSDRELLRAAHFFDENNRAILETEALKNGDTEEFFSLVNASGTSSAELLQNLFSAKTPLKQEIPLAIMLSKRLLAGCGAVRVHGGGFAGTIQAFVPSYKISDFKNEMERIFGENCCYVLKIRPVGGFELTP